MAEVPIVPGLTAVALLFVSKQGFSAGTVQSIIFAMMNKALSPARFVFLGDHTHVSGRNAACRDALAVGAEYLLFIDSDMDFPVDTLARLKACDADIACLDQWSRNIPSFRTVLRMGEPDDKGGRYALPVPDDAKGVQEVDVVGMGCTLIKTSLLRRMEDPWFVMIRHGEDASFCFVAKEKYGATIKCDFDACSGHWGQVRLTGQEWSRDAANQNMSVDDPDLMRRMGAKNVKDHRMPSEPIPPGLI